MPSYPSGSQVQNVTLALFKVEPSAVVDDALVYGLLTARGTAGGLAGE